MALNFFLTGATGFLGCHLLAELLARTDATVYCLVRSKAEECGRSRLHAALEHYCLWHADMGPRIVAVVGDLARPQLGLSDSEFGALADRVDAIYHNGALVNFVLPYEQLREPNVVACSEVLRLAATGKTKSVHFTSTLRVFAPTALAGTVIREVMMPQLPTDSNTGYSQSKWAAEKMMHKAQLRGLPVFIYRVGLVSGHSRSGAYGLSDLIPRAIKGCIQLGSVPTLEAELDWTPVDFVARAMVNVSLRGDVLHKVFHVVAPRPTPWSRICAWLLRSGYPLREVPYEHWRAQLTEVTRRSPSNALAPLQAFFRSFAEGQGIPSYAHENLDQALVGSDVECPLVDESVFKKYLEFFVQRGFLTPPSAHTDLKSTRGEAQLRA